MAEYGGDVESHPIYDICTQMAGFCYDTAKELAVTKNRILMEDRERDSNKASRPPLSGLMAAFGQLCGIEKQYYTLNFLTHRRFLMKDTSLMAVYRGVRNDLHKVEEWKSAGKAGEVAGQLVGLVDARLALMAFYELLASAAPVTESASGSKPEPSTVAPVEDGLVPKLAKICRDSELCLAHELLRPLRDLFHCEVQALHGIVFALHHMNHWRFFESLMEVDKCLESLTRWQQFTNSHNEPPRSVPAKSSFSFLFRSSAAEVPNAGVTEPLIYQWMVRMRLAVLSKWTFYFHDVVLDRSKNAAEFRDKCGKLSIDYPGRLQNFQKRHDVQRVFLLFDASTEVGYKGVGYHHANRIVDPAPSGLDLFPVAFSCPEKSPESLPALVLHVRKCARDLSVANKIVHSYDEEEGLSYLMMAVEPKFILALIFGTKKSEKEALVCTFLAEIASQLRGGKLFASLRPGYKSQQ